MNSPVVQQTRRAALPMDVIDRLFHRLIAFYGAKLMDAYQGTGLALEEVKQAWAEELATCTPAELNRGMNACRARIWPPTLPEFLGFCRPPLDHTAAYYEAVTNLTKRAAGENPTYSHPAIYWAAVEIGAWDMRNTPAKNMAPRWSACLARILECGQWNAVPPPPLELPPPQTKPPSPEQLAKLREQMNSITQHMKSSSTVGEQS